MSTFQAQDATPQSQSAPRYQTEVLIVGAGFAGIYLLHKLRGSGFQCLVLEATDSLGGTWNLNRYPGSRVDTNVPLYQLSIPEIWATWTWSERFPDRDEMSRYFEHVDSVLNIKKDVLFKSKVVSAQYLVDASTWSVRIEDGTSFTSTEWAASDTFRGTTCHSACWPSSGVDLVGKRVAVVGTGATGVQMAQEISRQASHLYVFQRTPNLCLPMRQRKLDYAEQDAARADLPRMFRHRLTTTAGYADEPAKRSIFCDSGEERTAFFERLWDEGGFKFWTANYRDVLFNEEANRMAYDFWAGKTRDPVSRATTYYEQLSKPHVSIIDVSSAPIVALTRDGLRTSDGAVYVCTYEVDVVGLATGFDALTGSMLDMGLASTSGAPLAEKWSNGVASYLGAALAGYPNLFYVFAAHGPTASNGPSCIELQSDWIVHVMVKMRRDAIESLEPTVEAEREWASLLNSVYQKSLVRSTRSWYDGSNVPAKRMEPLIFFGGFPLYRELCYNALDENFKGFKIRYRHDK
ncbi:hypothetical protein EsDP_00007337 [Epichloe bromicola]|uniref:FAD/NAD(P)-binding domain-containing protein n=1 Tax=Epichloe bromicola TaxID=79588 RepID=A0ABQ0D0A9_9HYPO